MSITTQEKELLERLDHQIKKWISIFRKNPSCKNDKKIYAQYKKNSDLLTLVQRALVPIGTVPDNAINFILKTDDPVKAAAIFQKLYNRSRAEIATIDQLETYQKEYHSLYKQWTEKFGKELDETLNTIEKLNEAIQSYHVINEFANERLDIMESLQNDLKRDDLTAQDQEVIQGLIKQTEEELAQVLN